MTESVDFVHIFISFKIDFETTFFNICFIMASIALQEQIEAVVDETVPCGLSGQSHHFLLELLNVEFVFIFNLIENKTILSRIKKKRRSTANISEDTYLFF
jgi:hypothetical protein